MTNKQTLLKIVASIVWGALLLAPRAFAATTATWTNAAGGNAWEVPGNWDINQVPATSAFDVRIATSAPCNLSLQFQIGALALSTGTAQLNLLPGSVLGIAGPDGINNNGTILVNPSAANTATSLRFDMSTSINGSGNIQLNGVAPGNASLIADGVTITNGVNHTIRGRGDISITANNAVFVNNGIINGDADNSFSPGDPLRLFLSDSFGNQNNGTLKASNGGSLYILQGFLDQRGGGAIGYEPPRYFGEDVILGDPTHTVTVVGGEFFDHVSAVNLTINGCTKRAGSFMTVPDGGLLTVLGGSLINNGGLYVSADGEIRFAESTAITGTGSFDFNDTFSVDGITVTFGPDQTVNVRGAGDIIFVANNARLINNGTISGADFLVGGLLRVFLNNTGGSQNNGLMEVSGRHHDCVLSLEQGTIDQSGGGSILAHGTPQSRAANGANSRVQIGGAETFTMIGGTLNTITLGGFTGLIQGIGAILAGNITNLGVFEIPANGLTDITAATLTNNATMTLVASSSLMRFHANSTIAGSGSIVLTNAAKVEIGTGRSVTHGSSHSLRGNGTIQINLEASLTNQGTIAPGLSVGTLSFGGNLQLTSSANLSIEIGGTTQGVDYDLLEKTDGGTLTLNGKLTLNRLNNFIPASSDKLTIVTTNAPLAGSFTNVSNGGRLATSDGYGSFLVTHSGNNVVLSDFIVSPPTPSPTPTPTPTATPTGTPGRISNLSTRAHVLTGDNVLIAGLIVSGSTERKVILRALGPSLSDLGVPDPLTNPTLELFQGNTLLFSNDDWRDSSQRAEIETSGFAPRDDVESAIIWTLIPGQTYTAIVRGKDGQSGVGVVDAYDREFATTSSLANISSRGVVGVDDNVMIAGVTTGLDLPNPPPYTKVLVRALGPSLEDLGVPGVLADPTIDLVNWNGTIVGSNDNWKSSQRAEIEAAHLEPNYDSEAALVELLHTGRQYTAIVRGSGGTTGVGLVEVYAVP